MRRGGRGWYHSATREPDVHTTHAPGPVPLRDEQHDDGHRRHPLGFAPSPAVEREPLLWEGDQA